MKKIKLLILVIFPILLGSVVHGQDITVTDFEGTAPTTGGYNINYSVVSNTLSGTNNSSANVGSVTQSGQYAAFTINTSQFVLSANPNVSFLFYSALPVASVTGTGRTVTVQLNGSGVPPVQVKFGISADQVNTWVPINLDFSVFPSLSYNQIQFTLVGSSGSDLPTYYFDDIKVKASSGTPPTYLPLYYESFSAGNGNNYTPGSGDASGFVGWNNLGTYSGLNINTSWPYPYDSDPASSDGFSLYLDNTVATTSPFIMAANVSNKSNLFVKFGIEWHWSASVGTDWRPVIDVNIDNTGWVALSTTPGIGTYPTSNQTWSNVTVPLLDANGNPLPAGNVLQVRIQNSSLGSYYIDDFYILQHLTVSGTTTTTTSGPTKVPVTVYYEPFNVNLSSECYPCYANTMTGWATGATVGGQMTVEPMSSGAYSKSYTFTSAATDDFIGFWSDKTTDITFSGINISGISDLAISFGQAQLYMTNATDLPKVQISIDGSDWLNLTKAGNGTQWGVSNFGGTFTNVSLPIKYGSTPLTGDVLSVRFYGLNGGQMDDLKITGTTIAGVVSTTTSGVTTILGPTQTLYNEPFAFNSWNGVTLIYDASTLTGLSSGATASGTMILDNAWDDHFAYAYKPIVNPDNILAFWTDKAIPTDVTFSGINIANYTNLAFSFGMAQDYGNVDARPQVFVSVDGGAWISLTTTGNGTQWPTVLASNNPVTFSGISLPLIDQNGSPLKGNTLSVNIKGSLNGYAFQMDDISVTGNTFTITGATSGNVSVTGITVSAPSASVITGQTLQFSKSILPVDATNQTVTWSVTNIAGSGTINSNGLFTANGLGTVKITATANDGSGVTGSLTVTVLALPDVVINLQSINVTRWPEDQPNVHIGGTLQLVTNVIPKNASDTSVTWYVVPLTHGVKNGTEGEASIDDTGLLTGITAGPINVVAVANDASGLTDTVLVLVSAITEITKEEQAEFSIYPNPATTEIHLTNTNSIKSVAVFDIVGSPVPAAVYSNGNINIAGIPSGIYFVRISTVDKKIINKKITKH